MIKGLLKSLFDYMFSEKTNALKTKSELLFEGYLNQRKIEFTKLDATRKNSGKAADYLVKHPSGNFVAEIKEIDLSDSEKEQVKLSECFKKYIIPINLGAGYIASFIDKAFEKDVKGFADFLNRIKSNACLKLPPPLCVVMPSLAKCLLYREPVVIELFNSSDQLLEVVISPETRDDKYPIPMHYSYIERTHWIRIKEKQFKESDIFTVLSGRPLIELNKTELTTPFISFGGFGMWKDDTKKIREDIKKASKQLEAFKDKYPCGLVLYSNSIFGIDDHELFDAMAGTTKIRFPVSMNGQLIGEATPVRDNDGRISGKKGTRFSFISILDVGREPLLRTFHNPYALKPLKREILNGPNDKQFVIDSSTGNYVEYKD